MTVTMLKPLLSASLLVLAIAGCSVQLPAAPQATTSAGAKSSTTAAAPAPTTTTAQGSAAAGTQLTGSTGAVDAADKPVTPPTTQGIAAGEPNPSGGRVIGTTAILTPCRRDFMSIDANGDGWIDAKEWAAAGKADADFKAQDKDASGQLDNGEYGCVDTAPNGGTPDGKG